MQPTEPSAADVSAVAAGLGIPETVQPAQQQPEAPTPQPTPSQQPAQPAPTSSDPFEALFTPTEPAQAPQQPVQQPAQPTEPVAQPTEQPQPQAQAPAPVADPAPQANPATMTSEEYIASLTAGLGEAPAMPDPSTVDANDEASIGKFFQDLMETAEKRFEAKFTRDQAIQNAEKQAWEASFDKYPSLRSNKGLRDTVHAIRRAKFDQGVAITPTQAAEELLASMGASYQRGIADNQVQTTIEQVQPNGGASQQVPTTLTNQNVLTAVQTGGEQALENWLDQEVKAGRM